MNSVTDNNTPPLAPQAEIGVPAMNPHIQTIADMADRPHNRRQPCVPCGHSSHADRRIHDGLRPGRSQCNPERRLVLAGHRLGRCRRLLHTAAGRRSRRLDCLPQAAQSAVSRPKPAGCSGCPLISGRHRAAPACDQFDFANLRRHAGHRRDGIFQFLAPHGRDPGSSSLIQPSPRIRCHCEHSEAICFFTVMSRSV